MVELSTCVSHHLIFVPLVIYKTGFANLLDWHFFNLDVHLKGEELASSVNLPFFCVLTVC